MISVEGQYFFKFSIHSEKGELSDFLDQEDFNHFLVVEETGNVLPTFSLSFLASPDVESVLEERAKLKIWYGKDFREGFKTDFVITKIKSMEAGENIKIYTITGMLDAMEYMNIPIYYISSAKESPVQAIRNSVFHFDIVSEIEPADNQIWICPRWTSKTFVDNLIPYVRSTTKCTAVALTINNKLVIAQVGNYDMKWEFSNIKEGCITYKQTAPQSKNGVFNDLWHGTGRQQYEGNMDTTEQELLKSDPVRLFGVDFKCIEGQKFGIPVFNNENMFEGMNEVRADNITNLVANSSVQQKISIEDYFYDFRPLDEVKLYSEHSGRSLDLNSSGFYIITKVVRSLRKSSFESVLTLERGGHL